MINQNGVYGLISGTVTTIMLQPFENIKMALMLPPRRLQHLHAQNNFFNNSVTSCKYIMEKDGIKGFYKGLVAASLKAGLGCYIYFTGLRQFQKDEMTAYNNFIASSVSRLISTFLTNPLSIIETRFQLAYFHGYNSVWSAAVDIHKKEGFKAFFSGGLSCCLKESLFGGFHYMFYEQLKQMGMGKVLSGISSGMLATTMTHPLEIIRAKLQTQGLNEQHSTNQHLLTYQLRQFVREGGWFRGLAPRLIKKPIANMLTFLFFEIFQERENGYQ